jgi:replication fork clamp-binding protein CrfC
MINSSWQDDHVSFFYPNPNPFVILVTDVKVPAALQAVADLFVSVHVLSEEVLQLLLIVLQFVRAYLNKVLQEATDIPVRTSYTRIETHRVEDSESC